MGSEHYCLRWNNHQSNLLGVFSQLLQDESLVDVTLACSEGASIRAHKVVLSACSSYFQSLFLDHPARHPIVILKDVRFAELRTLVEFMYKGEVNVQYCQLSALLKTAESLKVKGLAEMTNQSTAVREPEREPERLRPHSLPKSEQLDSSSSSITSPIKNTLTSSVNNNNRLIELQQQQHQQQQQQHQERSSPSPPTTSRLRQSSSSSPTPLALYGRGKSHKREHPDRPPSLSNDDTLHHNINPDERPTSPDDDDDQMMQTNDVGINMTLNSNSIPSSGAAAAATIVIPPVSSSSLPPDIRPSSRGHNTAISSISAITGGGGGSGGGGGTGGATTASSSGMSSPNISEPIAGPSGIGPVQQVPLSLKKEIEWDRGDDKECSSDYRHSHETEATDVHLGGVGGGPPSSQIIDQGGPMYPCMYCGASFPHQSKLTRHILSHSLETLKYRETPHLLHPGHHLLQQLPPDLQPPPPPSQLPPSAASSASVHFSSAAVVVAAAVAAQRSSQGQGSSSSSLSQLEPLEPPDGIGSAMDIDYGTAANAHSGSMSGGGVGGVGSIGSNEQGSVVLCKFCGKSFPDVSTLITHLPVHTGDRPFKCEFCGKAFKLRHHMKDHCRVHTGERPFRCSMCGKTFSRSTILKAHEKTHYPKYVRKFLSPSPVDTKDDSPQ